MSARVKISFTLNGRPHKVSVPPMKRLLDVLREECGATGTKEGCGEGECGACTVLLDGLPVNACLVPAIHADGAEVVTVEGLAKNGRLSGLQQAFVEMGAAQCGMCTPGMLVTSAALLATCKGRVPGDEEVREALAGTLCRCTGYQKIVEAVQEAARPAKKAKRSPTAKARGAKTKSSAAKRKPTRSLIAPARGAQKKSSAAKRKPARSPIAAARGAQRPPKAASRRRAASNMKKVFSSRRVAVRSSSARRAPR